MVRLEGSDLGRIDCHYCDGNLRFWILRDHDGVGVGVGGNVGVLRYGRSHGREHSGRANCWCLLFVRGRGLTNKTSIICARPFCSRV